MLYCSIVIALVISFYLVVHVDMENTTIQPDTNTGNNISSFIQPSIVESTGLFNGNQSLQDGIFLLNNLIIKNTVVILQNPMVVISNSFIVNSKVSAKVEMIKALVIENCTFEKSEFIVDSASNLTILKSHFQLENLSKDEEPKYAFNVFNTMFLLISNTIVGDQAKQNNQMRHLVAEHTTLGIKLENVSFAQIERCIFAGIKSEVSNGTAIYLKNANVSLVSCDFSYNLAKYGVIYAINSVTISTVSSSFLSNHAVKFGGVFYMICGGTLTNNDCRFHNNSASEGGSIYCEDDTDVRNSGCSFFKNTGQYGGSILLYNRATCVNTDCSFRGNYASINGGAIFGMKGVHVLNNGTRFLSNAAGWGGALSLIDHVTCINNNCSFHNNSASEDGGVIKGQDNFEITNIGTRFQSNIGKTGGVIYMSNHVTCINTDSIYQDNIAAREAGAIYGRDVVKLINNATQFLSNTGQWGGAMYVNNNVTFKNIDSSYQNNSASKDGGAIFVRDDFELINNGTKFIQNRVGSGGGAICSFDRGNVINTGSIFFKNHASSVGGVMSFWRGIKCTFINCNLTENTGIFKVAIQHQI